jgi:hypothetical protein
MNNHNYDDNDDDDDDDDRGDDRGDDARAVTSPRPSTTVPTSSDCCSSRTPFSPTLCE